jgi:hypothetical protein
LAVQKTVWRIGAKNGFAIGRSEVSQAPGKIYSNVHLVIGECELIDPFHSGFTDTSLLIAFALDLASVLLFFTAAAFLGADPSQAANRSGFRGDIAAIISVIAYSWGTPNTLATSGIAWSRRKV